jgi:hypothetical protein
MRIFVLRRHACTKLKFCLPRKSPNFRALSPNAIRNATARGREGDTIPPSFKLGGLRVGLRSITCARSI